jgi:hypothetical protein
MGMGFWSPWVLRLVLRWGIHAFGTTVGGAGKEHQCGMARIFQDFSDCDHKISESNEAYLWECGAINEPRASMFGGHRVPWIFWSPRGHIVFFIAQYFKPLGLRFFSIPVDCL